MSMKMHMSVVALSMEMAATCAVDVLKHRHRRETRASFCCGACLCVGAARRLTTRYVLDALVCVRLRPGDFFARSLRVLG